MEINPEWIASIAAFLTTVAFLPQTIKIIQTRDTSAISLGMYMVFSTGVAFWLVYGLMMGSYPIVIANICTLMLSGIILLMKWRLG